MPVTDREWLVKLSQELRADTSPKRTALKDGQFQEVPEREVDYEIESPNQFFGTHANLIPLQSSVASPRVFYGSRFITQALPVVNPETPWVQNRVDNDPNGRSFDDLMGEHAGARRAKEDGLVIDVKPTHIEWQDGAGKTRRTELYNKFPFNRKSAIHSTPILKPGETFKKGQLLATSNFTDKDGALAMGINARIGLVPYKGYSMDDAIVLSEDFAKRLTVDQLYGHDLDYKRGVKGGKAHHIGFFPNKFINKQLNKLDDEGVVLPGQEVNKDDPIILATRPKVISSQSSQLGQLSRHMRNARTDASILWDHDEPGQVIDVQKLRSGVKVNIQTQSPTKEGDKIVLRSGAKAIVSKIIPNEEMPRTVDGRPLEVLLNPLSIPSRVNNSLIYELLLGKAAEKQGKPYKIPSFSHPGEKWFDFVQQELDKHQLSDTEEVFDPRMNKKLENPITVGNGYVLALHHRAAGKMSVRGQGSYDQNESPLHSSGEGGQSKRLSGLESGALLSSGAYGVLKEGSTLRGQRSDDYWRMLREGYEPNPPGVPFVFSKFKALLSGSGYQARNLGKGKERLGFYRDADLDKEDPIEVRNGDIVDLSTLEPIRNGLFDPALVGGKKWGFISLPQKLPNPAAETAIRKLLGLTEAQLREILAGRAELPDHLRQ